MNYAQKAASLQNDYVTQKQFQKMQEENLRNKNFHLQKEKIDELYKVIQQFKDFTLIDGSKVSVEKNLTVTPSITVCTSQFTTIYRDLFSIYYHLECNGFEIKDTTEYGRSFRLGDIYGNVDFTF